MDRRRSIDPTPIDQHTRLVGVGLCLADTTHLPPPLLPHAPHSHSRPRPSQQHRRQPHGHDGSHMKGQSLEYPPPRPTDTVPISTCSPRDTACTRPAPASIHLDQKSASTTRPCRPRPPPLPSPSPTRLRYVGPAVHPSLSHALIHHRRHRQTPHTTWTSENNQENEPRGGERKSPSAEWQPKSPRAKHTRFRHDHLQCPPASSNSPCTAASRHTERQANPATHHCFSLSRAASGHRDRCTAPQIASEHIRGPGGGGDMYRVGDDDGGDRRSSAPSEHLDQPRAPRATETLPGSPSAPPPLDPTPSPSANKPGAS